MPDQGIVARDALADIEDRMGLPSIDKLLAERADLIKRVAPLRARHGNGGTYGDLRKIELSQIAAALRAKAVAASTKLTEAAIDEAAHADDRYVKYVTQATTERVDFIEIEDQIQAINDQINRGQAIARYLSAELALTR